MEYKKEIERLIEKISKYEDEKNQQKDSVEKLSGKLNEKVLIVI